MILINNQTKFLSACGLGVFLEFFDFALYAALSTIIASRFFPSFDDSSALLLSWGVFACSFIARPIGSVLFGHISDRLGIKRSLTISMVLMSFSTASVGLIPSYNEIGILAPLLLIFARVVQGVAIAPEYTASSVYMSLGKNNDRIGFAGSLTVVAAGLGLWAGGLIMSKLSNGYTVETLPEMRWRLVFILSGLLVGGFTIFLRRSMDNRSPQTLEKYPLMGLRNSKKVFACCTILSGFIGLSSYMIFGFISSFLQSYRGVGLYESLSVTTACTILAVIAAPISGYLSDKFSAVLLLKISLISTLVCSVTFFQMISYGDMWVVIFAISLMSIFTGMFSGAFPAFLSTAFPASFRATGSSLSHSLGISLFGGTGPLVMSLLYKKFENPVLPAYYLCLFAGLALISIVILVKPQKVDFTAPSNIAFDKV
tara:strand:- start:29123 stop:30403 length:1281 start_codon:yes stop_codon:yes gene_type:complete